VLAAVAFLLAAGGPALARAPDARPVVPVAPPPRLSAAQVIDRTHAQVAPLLSRGDQLLAQGQADAALEQYQAALRILLPDDEQGRIDVFLREGLAEASLGQCGLARRVISSIDDRATLTSDPARASQRLEARNTIEQLCHGLP
jgi:hypothetical protein